LTNLGWVFSLWLEGVIDGWILYEFGLIVPPIVLLYVNLIEGIFEGSDLVIDLKLLLFNKKEEDPRGISLTPSLKILSILSEFSFTFNINTVPLRGSETKW
jgi:hypothetical protein